MKIVIEKIDGYGYLPTIDDSDGYEVYRGEFKETIEEAFERAVIFAETRLDEDGYRRDV